jgi:hypothetical protein
VISLNTDQFVPVLLRHCYARQPLGRGITGGIRGPLPLAKRCRPKKIRPITSQKAIISPNNIFSSSAHTTTLPGEKIQRRKRETKNILRALSEARPLA